MAEPYCIDIRLGFVIVSAVLDNQDDLQEVVDKLSAIKPLLPSPEPAAEAAAQAIDARSGETAKTGSIGEADESAVRQDAPMIPSASGGAA